MKVESWTEKLSSLSMTNNITIGENVWLSRHSHIPFRLQEDPSILRGCTINGLKTFDGVAESFVAAKWKGFALDTMKCLQKLDASAAQESYIETKLGSLAVILILFLRLAHTLFAIACSLLGHHFHCPLEGRNRMLEDTINCLAISADMPGRRERSSYNGEENC
jgi:hypothetical protein